MSTIPVVDTAAAPPSGAVIVPHFAYGIEWTTQILLVNSTGQMLSGAVESRDDDGNVTATTTYVIPANASKKLKFAGLDATRGSMRVLPRDGTVAPIPVAILSYRPRGEITVSETGIPASSGTAFRTYVESSGSAGLAGSIQSGVAVTNNSSSPVTVKLELSQLDGSATELPAVVRTIPGFGHIAQFVAELFPTLPQPFQGVLRISSASSEISVVGLRSRYNERNDFLMTTTPPVRESDVANVNELVLPHLADGAGYTTQFVIFSGSGSPISSGSLLLMQNSGQPLDIPLH
jgi:hypothetical protein